MALLSSTVNRLASVRWTVAQLTLTLSVALLMTSWAVAQDDIGLPIHPKAIPSTIVRQAGEGEGTRWVQVHFTVNAPYAHVVKFYQEKAGRNAQLSQVDSGKLVNTLILISKDLADQFNVNISGEPGGKVTRVELSRNSAAPQERD